jgi:hypothetical protein
MGGNKVSEDENGDEEGGEPPIGPDEDDLPEDDDVAYFEWETIYSTDGKPPVVKHGKQTIRKPEDVEKLFGRITHLDATALQPNVFSFFPILPGFKYEMKVSGKPRELTEEEREKLK